MSPDQLIRTRQPDWQRLEQLLDQPEQQLNVAQIQELGRLYRAITSDLALAQRDFPTHRVASFLNQLVGRTHTAIYRDKQRSTGDLVRFFTHTMPQTWRACWKYIALASAMFWIPFFLGLIVTLQSPQASEILVMSQMHPMLVEIEDHQPWFYADTGGERAQFSAFVMTNNIRVAIVAFAGGMLAGILTAFSLISQGTTFGSLFGYAYTQGFYDLPNFAIGHGVIELNTICIAGAAGLLFAKAIIQPGFLKRADALYLAGRKALVLLLTAAMWLVVAGLIEGFISPVENLSPIIKWIVGWSSGALMFIYLIFGGRDRDQT